MRAISKACSQISHTWFNRVRSFSYAVQVINALLGGSFLAEGILPTTNEISVLKFRHAAHCTECGDADGMFPATWLCTIKLHSPPPVTWQVAL